MAWRVVGYRNCRILKLPDGSVAPWKEILTRTFADLHEEHKAGAERVVFLWDEVPFLLDNIRMNEDPQCAMEVLDTLRSLSQDYPGVRLLLTGSVGIHHVLTQLRKDGYNNSPLNTFERVAPGPLSAVQAVDLATRLIRGANLPANDPGEIASCIASLTGNVPFYIHRLISRMPKGEAADPESAEKLLIRELTDANNDWDLAHYRNRIQKYYPEGNDESVVLATLDSLAANHPGLSFRDLSNQVKSTVANVDDERFRTLVKLLQADHYVTRNDEGNYLFRLEIVRRWWTIDRSL